jgi:hypothetical protein
MLLVGGYLFNSCTQKVQDKESQVILDYKDSTFTSLSVTSAEMMAKNYATNYLPLIKKELNNNDARAIWFSLDDLKNFIWQIEYHSIHAGVGVKPKDLGIRIYYAQYPSKEVIINNESLKDLNPEYADKHSLFLVPTIKKNNRDMDFDPRKSFDDIKAGKEKEILPIERIKGDDRNPNYRFIQTDRSTIMNHGGLCPPGCPY